MPIPKASAAAQMPRLGNAGSLSGPIAAVAAVSPSDVWGVGGIAHGKNQANTLTEHWDGTRWSVVPAPDVVVSVATGEPGDFLTGVTAVSSHDVWAVGVAAHDQMASNGDVSQPNQTLAEHWDGHHWAIVPTPDDTTDDFLTAVSGRSSSDVWAVGAASHVLTTGDSAPQTPLVEHWDGTRWSVVHVHVPNIAASNDLDATFSAVHAIAGDDVWAVGVINSHGGSDAPSQTFTEHWNGTTWSVVDAPDVRIDQVQHDAEDSLDAVSATRSDDVWAVGAADPQGGLILHWDGSSWSIVPSAHSGFNGYVGDVAALSADDVWAVGSTIEHWDGHQWNQIATIDGKTYDSLLAIAAASPHDIWMVAPSEFLHYTCA